MKKTFLLLSFFAAIGGLRAQLFVDTAYAPSQMVSAFFNQNGVTVSNITYSGGPASIGFFEGSQSNIGLNAGLLFTSGNAMSAIGPNISGSTTTSMGIPGSAWLDALIPGYITNDASIIEMDVVTTGDTLAFSYVFASEEYQEFVNTSFNDLFAFLVTGPGLTQDDSIWVAADTSVYFNYQDSACLVCVDTFLLLPDEIYCWFDSLAGGLFCDTIPGDTLLTICYYDENNPNCVDTVIYPGYWYVSPGGLNIAMVPGTNLPVAINTINQFSNTQFFIANEQDSTLTAGQTVEYDAFTTPLWASIPVQAGQTYHIRLAVADAGDQAYDSGVFLSVESLNGDSLLPAVPQFSAIVQPGSTEVTFQNNTLWATKWHWDFGDGTTSDEKYPPAHKYSFLNSAAEGVYTVKLTASNWCSSKTFVESIYVNSVPVHEPQATDFFAVFPNPSRGQVTIDLKKPDVADLRLFGADGRLLLSKSVGDGERIDLDRFGKGFFNLQLVFDGQVFNQKVVNN